MVIIPLGIFQRGEECKSVDLPHTHIHRFAVT